jgi:hypothetical protein
MTDPRPTHPSPPTHPPPRPTPALARLAQAVRVGSEQLRAAARGRRPAVAGRPKGDRT